MFAIIEAAGWPIWPLLFASVIAVALIIERSITLRRAKIVPPGLLEKIVAEYRQKGLRVTWSIALRPTRRWAAYLRLA